MAVLQFVLVFGCLPGALLHMLSTDSVCETETLILKKTLALKASPAHRLNMKLDLLSLFVLHVHSCTHWLRPRNPLPPAFGLISEGAIGQPR
jgi:hypothetical protein